jgi:uncharacterized protein YkwD
MPARFLSSRFRMLRTRRTAALAALAGLGVAALFALPRLDDGEVFTYAQLDRGILAGAGKDSPALSLAHPWTGSSPEWEEDALMATFQAEEELRVEAYLAAVATALEEQAAEEALLPDEQLDAPSTDESAPAAEPATAVLQPSPRPAAAAPRPAPSPPEPEGVAAAPVAPQQAVEQQQPRPQPRAAAVATATPVPPPAVSAPPPAPAAGLASLEQQLFDGQNAERARAGLAPLRLDSALQGVARRRANDMATRGYFSHTSPTGETAFSLIDAAGIYAPYAAENIAFNNYANSQSATSALQAFMASSSHRANILNGRYTRVGVAVALAANGYKYYAVVFAGP